MERVGTLRVHVASARAAVVMMGKAKKPSGSQGLVPDEGYLRIAEFSDRVASLDVYHECSQDDRDRLKETVYKAQVNKKKFVDENDRSIWLWVPLWAVLAMAGQWNIDTLGAASGISWRIVIAPLVGALVVSTLASALGSILPEDDPIELFGFSCVGTLRVRIVLGVCSTLLFLTLVKISISGAIGALLSLFVVIVSVAVSLAIFIVSVTAYEYARDQLSGPKIDPRDALISSLSEILEEVASTDDNWKENRAARQELSRRIEHAAIAAQRNIPLLVGSSQPAVRGELKSLAGRIASALNRYATDVAIGGVERDRGLVDNIANALIFVSFGRWEELAADEEHRPVRTVLRRFIPRIFGGAVLLAAGVFGPDLIGTWAAPVAPQLRVALIAAAILSIIDTPRSATERIADAFKGR